MKVVIVGGGKLGYYLTRNMLDRGYEVSLIEKDKIKSIDLANSLGIEVICGDGTEIQPLTDADISHADCFIAVTGRDQDNLVASQLVKRRFMVDKVIARANNPRNLEALRQLGVNNAVSSTEIITRMIEQEVDSDDINFLATLNRGKATIFSFIIPLSAKVDGVSIKNIQLPGSSLIISVVREERLIIPQGDTVLHNGDEVVVVCESNLRSTMKKIFAQTK